MAKPPALITLCLDAIKYQLLCGHADVEDLFELPSELFNSLLPRLPPLALQRLQEHMPDDFVNGSETVTDQRKRKRDVNFDTSWRALYLSRWPCIVSQSHGADWLVKENKPKNELADDWQQFYWETHLQSCLDAAAEIALLPFYNNCIGDVRVPDIILEYFAGKGHSMEFMNDYSKLLYHFHKFGVYARSLRLRNVHCVAEICNLLESCKLTTLEVRWIRSEEHVQGLCKLLHQNNATLTSVKFIHCKLSSSFVDSICNSLFIGGLKTYGIQHFSITASSFLERNASIPVGFIYFLSSGRSLSSLSLCDNQLRHDLAKVIFSTLLSSSSTLTTLDFSENNISGCFSHFKWIQGRSEELYRGIGTSLQSLRVLNLRNSNLQKNDADGLKYVLVHMPNLDTLDLSDNAIEDDGIKSLISFFVKMSEQHFHLVDLKLGNCGLTCYGVNQLLEFLSTITRPLNSLLIGGNELGDKVGAPLGRFLCTGIRSLDVEDIGLGSSGFIEAQEGIAKTLRAVHINISKNRGGIEAAKFISKLIAHAPELVSVEAGYNFMPMEALSVISSSLTTSRGKLEHLDLTGNNFVGESLSSEFQNAMLIPKILTSPFLNVPYDNDP